MKQQRAHEPTSNVDLEHDAMVHRALFSLDATVMVICHRLQHIGGFDRIVIMEQGLVAEDDAPQRMLADPTSTLCKMCHKTGLSPQAMLAAL